MAEAVAEEEGKPAAKVPIVIMASVILALSLAAIGTGYLVSVLLRPVDHGQISSQKTRPADPAANAQNPAGKASPVLEIETRLKDTHQILKLDPIIVTLAKNSNTWLRMELALVVDENADLPVQAQQLQLLADISAFSRNIDLSQLESPSGYLHLQEDLLARARHLLGHDILEILILSLVAE